MIYISHRGNLNGPIGMKENHPSYIKEAIRQGFQVEIDVWYDQGKFILGHDRPQYEVKKHFLLDRKLWCHAKNHEAFQQMMRDNKIHCFWHEEDDFTITSKGFVWAYPGNTKVHGIWVMPERYNLNPGKNCLGICSDYVQMYSKRR